MLPIVDWSGVGDGVQILYARRVNIALNRGGRYTCFSLVHNVPANQDNKRISAVELHMLKLETRKSRKQIIDDDVEAPAGTRIAHMQCNADLNFHTMCTLVWDSMGRVHNPKFVTYDPIRVDYITTRRDRIAMEGNSKFPDGYDKADKVAIKNLERACDKAWSRLLKEVAIVMEDPRFCRGEFMPTSGATSAESQVAMDNKQKREASKSVQTLKRDARALKLKTIRDSRNKAARDRLDRLSKTLKGIAAASKEVSSDLYKLEVNRAKGRDHIHGSQQSDTEKMKGYRADLATLNKIFSKVGKLIDKEVMGAGLKLPS